MTRSTPTSPSDPRPARTTRPAAEYHDDLPDIFEPLPFDAHMHWAIEHMGIEIPGELIDDAPVILPDDGGLRPGPYDDPAPFGSSVTGEDAGGTGRRNARRPR